jgi:hypothetical protein
LHRADARFSANFRGNRIVLFSKSDISFSNHDLDFYLQNTVPAPRARAIAYNAVCPISALGFKSPTLAQLMARYATTDPILFSAIADKRKGLSLIAPPAAKKRRTVKKVLIEVKFPLFLITRLLFTDKSRLVRFKTRTQQSSASEPANAPSTGMTFITFSSKINTGIHP